MQILRPLRLRKGSSLHQDSFFICLQVIRGIFVFSLWGRVLFDGLEHVEDLEAEVSGRWDRRVRRLWIDGTGHVNVFFDVIKAGQAIVSRIERTISKARWQNLAMKLADIDRCRLDKRIADVHDRGERVDGIAYGRVYPRTAGERPIARSVVNSELRRPG